jgi:Long-chain fatty aldehyde decarbonylase
MLPSRAVEAIPNHPSYRAVERSDTASMVEPARYAARATTFDSIVSSTGGRYWDPSDPRYIDFGQRFPIEEELILPPECTPELNTAATDGMDERTRIRFGNELTRFHLSQLLHGEQGGVLLCADLCLIFQDPGAQEYAANQVREETRHVNALTRYFGARWGGPGPVGPGLLNVMRRIVQSGEVYHKIVGMQLLIEGLALGALSHIYKNTRDPVLRRLSQLILTDESYHHRFGQIWGHDTIPTLSETQHRQVENWTAGAFLTIFQNLNGLAQKRDLYERFGLTPDRVAGALRESLGRERQSDPMQTGAPVYSVLVKSLNDAGLITERTRALYETCFDLNALSAAECDEGIGDEIADRTMAELRDIHQQTRRTRPGRRVLES